MTTKHSDAVSQPDESWQRYGRALLQSMADVRSESTDDVHPILMETADYWLSVGLAIGVSQPDAARRLLEIIERDESERTELGGDADAFIEQALE
jgi:hypothetical protein